ncbi:MAG: TSUP family transporter [Polyangiaceae bacterium]
MSTLTLAALVFAAFAAGIVDSIAGGGGVITVPVLLSAGLDPRVMLATNKGQAIFGSTSALIAFARQGEVDRSRAPYSFVAAMIGALGGAALVLAIDPALLRPIVLVLLLIAAATAFIRKPTTPTRWAIVDRAPSLAAVVVAMVIGAYDGFFGPGTGTFLLLAYAIAFGDTLVRASGNAKVANMASNLASFALFAASGNIRWEIALPMGLAQVAGAQLGSRLAIRRGAGVVRAVAVTVSLCLAARVGWQMWSAH